MNNLYLIVGENKEDREFYLENILTKINAKRDDIIQYDLSENNLGDILDEASMISLFSQVKVIIGNNFDVGKISDSESLYLTKYLASINNDVYIILITPKIDARLKIYKLFKDNFTIMQANNTDNKVDVVKYVSDRIKSRDYKVDNIDITYFLSKVGNDINNINLELDKLFIYRSDSKVIKREDIELLISDNIDSVIYEFTNAFLENDLDVLVKMYHNFKLENIGFDYLIAALSNTLRQALIIKLLKNDNKTNLEISKAIGKKEFFVKKMLERIYQYTANDLADYITKLAMIDANYKSGKSNLDELELFLINKNMKPYE